MGLILGTGHNEAVTGLVNGTFLTIWNDSGNIPTAQFYNADGTKKGGPIALAAGSSGENINFKATSLSDGRFVVVWEEKGVKNSISARIFDMDGTPAGDTFKIASAGAAQTLPEVTALKNGGFAVASINEGVATSVIVDANGVQKGPFALKAGAVDVSIAALADDRLVSIIGASVAGKHGVYGDIQETDGSNYGSGEVVPAFSDSDLPVSSVTVLADGSFILAFDGVENGDDAVIFYRYSSNGESIGNGLHFGAGTGQRVDAPVVKALPGGGFAFAYVIKEPTGNYVLTGSSRSNWLGVLFSEQVENSVSDQSSPEIAVLNDGRYIVSWLNTSKGVTTTQAKIFDPRSYGVDWVGTALSEQYVGTDYSDDLNGGGGDDTIMGGRGADALRGGLGADRMIGGAGDDTYYVDDAGDQVVESSSGGKSDRVNSSISYALGAHVENLYASGSSSINLTGNMLANTIKGNAGANKIDGGAGKDTLYGGAGKDTLYGGAGKDTLYGGLGKDTLYGGAGKDTFIFNTKASSSNVDKIADYNVSHDSIYLDNKYFTKLGKGSPTSPKKLASSAFWKGAKAHDKSDRIIYDDKKGYLYYDADGSGTKYKQVLIATMSKKLKMSAGEFFVI